jgi:hypothetical protein
VRPPGHVYTTSTASAPVSIHDVYRVGAGQHLATQDARIWPLGKRQWIAVLVVHLSPRTALGEGAVEVPRCWLRREQGARRRVEQRHLAVHTEEHHRIGEGAEERLQLLGTRGGYPAGLLSSGVEVRAIDRQRRALGHQLQ